MHFKLIVAFVEDSKTDAIMHAAREAGATGCTVINNARGEGMAFGSVAEARRAYETGQAELQARVKVRIRETRFDEQGGAAEEVKRLDTTIGRAILSEILPEGLSFDLINAPMDKRAVSRLSMSTKAGDKSSLVRITRSSNVFG